MRANDRQREYRREMLFASALIAAGLAVSVLALSALNARDPLQIIRWFILRWQVEVTFQEARAHLGVETQRQWSDRAVARTTPCLFGLFSIVTLLAAQLGQRVRTAVWIDSWNRKSHPTFADALVAVRQAIWRETGLLTSRHRHKMPKPSQALQRCLIYALCQAA